MNIKGRVKSITAALQKKRQQIETKLSAIAENDRYVIQWVGKIGDHCDSKGYADIGKDDWEMDDLIAFTETDDELAGYFLEYFKRVDELRQQIKKEMGV